MAHDNRPEWLKTAAFYGWLFAFAAIFMLLIFFDRARFVWGC